MSYVTSVVKFKPFLEFELLMNTTFPNDSAVTVTSCCTYYTSLVHIHCTQVHVSHMYKTSHTHTHTHTHTHNCTYTCTYLIEGRCLMTTSSDWIASNGMV